MKIQFSSISSHATLKEIFTAKYNGVLPRTPQVRPKSKIYTPKRDNEHPHPFHVDILPPTSGYCKDPGKKNHVAIYLRTSFRVELGRLYLTIIPGARMGSESVAHEAEG